jgi:hypothetical protein
MKKNKYNIYIDTNPYTPYIQGHSISIIKYSIRTDYYRILKIKSLCKIYGFKMRKYEK